jgi:hypothetical protein
MSTNAEYRSIVRLASSCTAFAWRFGEEIGTRRGCTMTEHDSLRRDGHGGVVGAAISWMTMEILIPILFAILIDRQTGIDYDWDEDYD